jgi:hypothetical protein
MEDEKPDGEPGSVPVSIRLPEEIAKQLDTAQSQTLDLNRTQVVVMALRFGLPLFEQWAKKAYGEFKRPTP